jgi:hypothetical protein
MAANKAAGRLAQITAQHEALARMRHDEDISAEARQLSRQADNTRFEASASDEYVPLNWKPGAGGHRPNAGTLRLLQQVGGIDAIARFTDRFYQRAFADPHIDQFIRDHADPHGTRFAAWIAEKFGDGTPWTKERRSRSVCPFQSHGHQLQSPHDRSSAHFAAWHSPKRDPEKFGEHFKLDDCRVWMRLHFWAMREVGLFEDCPQFCEYYIKFLGHFVSVYEQSATVFARESARWSADPLNVERYLANGNQMEGVIGVKLQQALKTLPAEERSGEWPYEY